MKKILVTGSTGLVGSRFVEKYSQKYSLITPSRAEFDAVSSPVPDCDAIINFAAFTNVGESEKQRDDKSGIAWQTNVEGVKNLSTPSVFLLHISSDMVFSGSKNDPGPYDETYKPEEDSSVLSWYGYTKAQGETHVDVTKNAILRLIYPVRASFADKADYLHFPLQKFDEGKLYPIFSDQQVSITFIDEACMAIEKILDNQFTGIFHASSSDVTTPLEIITYMLQKVRNFTGTLAESSLEEYLKTSTPGRYPLVGGLDVKQTEEKLGLKFSTCHQIVDQLFSS